MRSQKNLGFTLIELMITIAIIGILAGIAIPGYQNYMRKANVLQGVTLAAGMKTAMVNFYNTKGRWTSSDVELGIPYASSAIDGVIIGIGPWHGDGNGELHVHYPPSVLGLNQGGHLRLRYRLTETPGGMLKVDCTDTDGSWPTSAELLPYINC